MRVAALYDVHGNLPALEAVLAEVDAAGVDAIVCGGDVAAGPFPVECLELLRAREAVFIRGNADRELSPWLLEQLSPAERGFLAELPHVGSLDGVLYCHGSPRSDDEILTRVSPDERFRAALAAVEAKLVVGGHTHVQFERDVDGARFVNAGSVGMPYEGRPGAFWALVSDELVELRRTPYALDAAVAAIRATGYPGTDDLCSTLLDPESPDEASAYFESLVS
ncbi:MAG: metallophosphatase family protein [Gaiellaceae bacterium MAG52_C11]|nr:metallophosphatase family protein [Candidatus Gaiellasilicea maunaloa]